MCVCWQINQKDGYGRTAAWRAAKGGDAGLLAVCRLSLCVCFVRMLCLGVHSLLLVCVPQELIEVGADAAMANKYDGITPAHWAAANGHADCLVVLREAGVDLGVADNNGQTPADFAAEEGNAECEALLKGWGY